MGRADLRPVTVRVRSGQPGSGRRGDALAVLLERDPTELAAAYLPVLRELVEEGFVSLQ